MQEARFDVLTLHLRLLLRLHLRLLLRLHLRLLPRLLLRLHLRVRILPPSRLLAVTSLVVLV